MPFGVRENRSFLFSRTSIVLLNIAVLACMAACQNKEDEERRFQERLGRCVGLNQKDLSGGTRCFEELLKTNPEKIVVRSFLANNYRELGELGKAEEEIRIFLKAYSSDALGRESYCKILSRKDEFDKALEECLLANQLKPNDGAIWLTTAAVQEKAGKISAAESSYKKALGIDPNDEAALLYLGTFYERQGRLDDAIATLESLLQLNPVNAARIKEGLEKLRAKRNLGKKPLVSKPTKPF